MGLHSCVLQGAEGLSTTELPAESFVADLRAQATVWPPLSNRSARAPEQEVPSEQPTYAWRAGSATVRQLHQANDTAAGSGFGALGLRRVLGQVPSGPIRLEVVVELVGGSEIRRVVEVTVAAAAGPLPGAGEPPPPPVPVSAPGDDGAGWFGSGREGAGSARTVLVVYVMPLVVVAALAAWLGWRWQQARRKGRIGIADVVAEEEELRDECLRMVVAESSYVRPPPPRPGCTCSSTRVKMAVRPFNTLL